MGELSTLTDIELSSRANRKVGHPLQQERGEEEKNEKRAGTKSRIGQPALTSPNIPRRPVVSPPTDCEAHLAHLICTSIYQLPASKQLPIFSASLETFYCIPALSEAVNFIASQAPSERKPTGNGRLKSREPHYPHASRRLVATYRACVSQAASQQPTSPLQTNFCNI